MLLAIACMFTVAVIRASRIPERSQACPGPERRSRAERDRDRDQLRARTKNVPFRRTPNGSLRSTVAFDRRLHHRGDRERDFRHHRQRFRLAVGERARADVTMGIGGVAAVVNVADQTPTDTETSTIGDTITTARIQDNPVNGRDFTQLLATVPGSVQTHKPISNEHQRHPVDLWRSERSRRRHRCRPRRSERNLECSGPHRITRQPRQHGQHSGSSGARAELFGTIWRSIKCRDQSDHEIGNQQVSRQCL